MKNKLFGKVDALFISNTGLPDLNFNYFTQMPSIFGSSYLIVKPKKQIIFTSFLDYGAVKRLKLKAARLIQYKKNKEIIFALQKELKGCTKIGFNDMAVSKKKFAVLKKIFKGKKLIDCSQELGELRAIKSKEEIRKMKQAVKIALESLQKVETKIRPGLRETEIAVELDCLIRKSEAENTFSTIVASGKNAGIPHHITSSKKLKKGELLLIDFGARYQLYGCDISRTYCLGKATEKQKELYITVYDALQKSLKEIVPGYKAQDAFQIADTVLKEGGFKMQHALGHGIGLKDHDFPGGIGLKSKWLFQENMCLAVEPAIYTKNFGIRLEDNLVVRKGAPLMLSKAPSELIEL